MTPPEAHSSPADPADPAVALIRFVEVMRRLLTECAWKAAQTHSSLARYLLEETYETLEVLDSGDVAGMREELGDLLLQVVLHSVMAERDGDFTLAEVIEDVTAKMVHRNPHVFGPNSGGQLTPEEVNELYQQAKETEKARGSVLDGLPASLPALSYADKVAERMTRAGSPPEAPSEQAQADDVGEALLAVVLRARADGTDPEQALRRAVARRIGPTPAGLPAADAGVGGGR